MKNCILFLQPPSPPFVNVMRDYAGGYGVASKSLRDDYGHEGAVVPYISLLYGTAVLKATGYSVDFVDGQAEKLTLSEVLSRVREINPRLLVAVLSLPSMKGDLQLIHEIKQILPDLPVIVMGTVCKLLYDKILADGEVTAAIRGDVETVLPNLTSAVLNGGDLSQVEGIAYRANEIDSIHVTADAPHLQDLDSLPMIPYELLPVDLYWHGNFGGQSRYMEILDSRGCPHRCASYCPYPFGFGNKMIFRSAELVVDEIDYLKRKYGIENFLFRGQTFTMRREHAEGICESLLRRDLQVKWVCETRLDSVDKPILELMRRAGCQRVHFGLESGDPEMFKKTAKPGCDLFEMGKSVEMTKKSGLFVRVNVILGLPGESWTSIQNTIKTLRQWQPNEVQAEVITPYPGTALYEEIRQKGYLLTEDWTQFTGFHPVMRTEHLTPAQLVKGKNAVANALYATPFLKRATRKALRMAHQMFQNRAAS